jgi:peroxiredoxin
MEVTLFSERLRSFLGVSVQLVMLLAGIAVTFTLVKQHYESAKPRDPRVDTLSSGQQFPLKHLWPEKGTRLILLAVQPTCKYCTESKNAFQALVRESARSNARVAMISSVTPTESISYAKFLGLDIREAYQQVLPDLKIPGTPAVLVVNDKGMVEQVSIGRIGEKEAEGILARLQAAHDSRPTLFAKSVQMKGNVK